MKKLLYVFALLASWHPGAPLAAQAKPGPPSPEMQQLIQNATKKYQDGDLKGAIALLEPLRARANAHPAALSLLGSSTWRPAVPRSPWPSSGRSPTPTRPDR